MGSSMAYGAVDYDKMYREADEKMYEDKRMRKKLAEETNTIESQENSEKMKELSHHGNPENHDGIILLRKRGNN